MAMSSVAKKDKPTMSVTALINWARPLQPGQPPQPMTPTPPNLLQPLPAPSNIDCSLDIQCKYSFFCIVI